MLRRFLIWSALAALVGLVLAGGAYWAYWNFYARFQPVTITSHQAEIQRLLDEASWVSSGGGGAPVYVVGYRDSAATMRYEREEAPKLRAAGADVRMILFARADREGLAQSTPAERATIAELWLTRDWSLYQRWTATPSRNWTAAGIPSADNNLARAAVVEASRQFVNRLAALLRDAGVQTRYPLVIWRDQEGYLKGCACADSRSWAFIRDDLDAPDRVAGPAVEPGAAPPAPAVYPGDGTPEVQPGAASLPYPALPPPYGSMQPAPLPGEPVAPLPGPAAAPGGPAAPPAQPPRSPQPRPAPQPSQQQDSTFF